MKKNIYILQMVISCLLLFVATITTSYAQDLAWVGNLALGNSGSDNISVESVVQDGNSDVYIVGSFQETADFDMGAGVFNLNSPDKKAIFVAKYDLNGNFIRVFQIGHGLAGNNSEAYDIAVDGSNNIVIVGTFTSDGSTPVDFNPLGVTPRNLFSTNANFSDAFIAKYDALGQCTWAMGMGNLSYQNIISEVSIDASDNIYVAGKMNAPSAPININPLGAAQPFNTSGIPSDAFTDAILFKYNSNGLYQWDVNIGNGTASNLAYDVVVNGTNVSVVGRFQATTNFNPKGAVLNKTSAGSYDGFIAQYNTTTGLCNWAGAIGTSVSQDYIRTIATDAAGNIYIGGEFRGTTDLDISAGTSNVVAVGTIDFYVAKYNTAGVLAWGFAVGQLSTSAIYALDVDGTNLYITGRFKNTADFDPGVGIANLSPMTAGIEATYLGKYSTVDGSYINAFTIQGAAANGGSVLCASGGVVYLAGFFEGINTDFDGTMAGTAYMDCANPPAVDGFIACYSETPVVTIEKIAITEWLANPFGSDAQGEWVEIYNYGATAVNLKNWRLKDEDSDNSVISTTDLFLPAGERFILARNKSKFEEFWLMGCVDSRVIDVGMIFANGTDEIVLENPAGDVVWSVAYQNDDTEGRATHYTEASYPTRVFGSKASPGVVRAGNDVTGSLGYQKNNSTTDNQAVTNTNGDVGSPLNIRIPERNRGNTLVFDGVDDYLDLKTLSAIENQAQFTFETWIKPLSIDANSERIFSKRNTNTNRIEISLGNGTNREYLNISICNTFNETVRTPDGSVPLGVWSHVAVVFDGTLGTPNNLKVYVNGIAQTVTGSLSSTTTGTGGNANIGRQSNNGANPSNIELDELRFWNVARTETQVREKMHLTLSTCETGLLAYYQLNETSGIIAKNLKGIDAGYGNGTAATFPTRAASIVNVGYGVGAISQTILGVGTGIQTFATANLAMEINAHSSLEDITVTYQTFAPNAVTGIDATNIIQNPMWTINTSKSTETIKADYVFTLPVGLLTSLNPSKYGLYWRAMNDGATWTKLATASVVTATTIKFSNMSLTGQFMVVQESDDLISDVRGAMCSFDGADDHISLGNVAAMNFGKNSTFTVDLWVKVSSASLGSGQFVTKYNDGGGFASTGWQVGHLNGVPTFVMGGGSIFDLAIIQGGTIDIRDDAWHHIAVSYNGSNNLVTGTAIYLDGKLQSNTNLGTVGTIVGTVTNSSNVLFGAFDTPSDFMNGALEEVSIWNVVRSQTQIRENMHLTLKGNETGLVSYYQFNNDGAINTVAAVKDAIGGNDGQTLNMVAANYLASEVAIAGGTSDRATVVAGDVRDFVNTGVHMEFGVSAPNGEIVVFRLETEKPHGASFITGDVDNEYFIVRNFGTTSFAALLDITFGRMNYIDPVDVLLPQASSPLQLYKRADNLYGNTWGTSLGGADNATAGSNGSVGYNTVNNITSFSQIVVVNTSTNSDLPVELLYFDAERLNADEVQLSWATATETNNQGFYVERMLDNQTQFSEITWVAGNGTTVNTNYYGSLDENSHLGTSYYRLRQIDFDGTTTYSEVKAVAGRSSGNYIDLSIYPNPVKDKLTLEFKQLPKQVTAATIKILAMDGKLLHQFSQKINSNQVINIGFVTELHPGVYMLAIETNDEEIVMQKFVKQ